MEVRLTALPHLTLTHDLDFQSQTSYDHDAHTHKFKFKGQSVQNYGHLKNEETDMT